MRPLFTLSFFALLLVFGTRTFIAQDGESPTPVVVADMPKVDVPKVEPKTEPSVASESYLVWYLKALGPLFAPTFGFISVVFVMLAVMNAMVIQREKMMPQGMIERFKQLVNEKKYQEAYELTKASDSALGKIISTGLARISSGFEAAQQMMSVTTEEEIMRFEQRLGYIATIASISPLVGLLGTVFGMVDAFQVIARSGQTPQASELAAGISLALVTTQVGLLIAIPALVVYEYLRNQLALLVLELTVQTDTLMAPFKSNNKPQA